ncbi:MAG: AAA family ATPase [Thermomicrobiales bacterium]|nr:AAA family ATPase [Thermomicrobiales bacterium]
MAPHRIAGTTPGLSASRSGLSHEAPAGPSRYVGRVTELARVRAAIDAICRGEGRALLVAGEAGIGKSRLIREGMQYATACGALTAHAECPIEPGTPPYEPWIRALRVMPRGETAFLLEGLSGSGAATPYSSWRSRQLSADEARYRLQIDMLASLERELAGRPLLVCIDDLQWADASSLQLFQFLARRCGALPVGLIGGFRSDEGPPESDAAAELTALIEEGKLERIDLTPLLEEESRQLIAQRLPAGAPPVPLLHAQSEGNPFVLEETIRLLAHLPPQAAGDGDSPLPLPPSVTAAIRMRLERLPPETRAVLEMAAVAGKTFHVDLVARACGISADEAAGCCEDASRRTMLLPVDSMATGAAYQFIHDRFRSVVMTSIPAASRRQLHLHLARAIEAAPGDRLDPETVRALAVHFHEGGEPRHAARYYRQLGDLAVGRHAPIEAADAYQSALRSGGEEPYPGRSELLMSLGRAFLSLGKRDAIAAFSEAAERSLAEGDFRNTGVASDHLARALAADEQHVAAHAAFDRALAFLTPLDHPEAPLDRAAVLIHLSETLGPALGRFDAAMRAQRQALQLLPVGPDGSAGRAEASLALGRTLMRVSRLDEATRVLEEALPTAVGNNHLAIAAEIEASLATALYWQGNVHDSRRRTLNREAYARASGDNQAFRHIRAWLALVESALGNLDRADELVRESERDVSAFDSPEPQAFARQVRGHLAFLKGEYAVAAECMLESIESFRTMGATTALWYIGYAARASHHAGLDRERDALVDAAWTMVELLPSPALPRAATLAQLGLLSADMLDAGSAARVYRELAPYRDQLHWVLVDRAKGTVARFLGLTDDAIRHLDAAIALARRHDLTAELRLAADQRYAIDGQGGILVAASSARPRESGTLPAGLTGREVEILRLVAAGRTNRQIAVDLGIAEKTVRNHLTHIMDKTDLDNRAAAAAFAVRHGLA